MEVLRLESGDYQTQLTPKYQNRKAYSAPEPIVKAAIPGTIMEVLVKEGQKVKRGDALCVLDSMKDEQHHLCIRQRYGEESVYRSWATSRKERSTCGV